MDIASAISQPIFSCKGGRPFAVPMWNNSVSSGVPLTPSCPQPEIEGSDCPFNELMSMTVAYTFCSYDHQKSPCNTKRTPDCSIPCSEGSCNSCEGTFNKKCQSSTQQSLVNFDDFFACQKQFKQNSRYYKRLGMNCSATVRVPASPTGITFRSATCYYDSPKVIVQCDDSGTGDTELTNEILLNFLLMLALGIGEVICKTMYVSHFICVSFWLSATTW